MLVAFDPATIGDHPTLEGPAGQGTGVRFKRFESDRTNPWSSR